MITFADLTSPACGERCVDRQLWLACAGGMCTVPPVGASVYYFPQGHAEHAAGPGGLDLSAACVPALVPCRVAAVRYMADPDTDEVFARIRLVPLRDAGLQDADAGADDYERDEEDKPASFAKTLTQSDANNGGGFSVPRYCAETIFPRLDYAADPPVQTVVARDVHGAAWKFRHIYRGTPRRHLLTTGWSTFVNSKKLVAGDSIVFLRGAGGDLHVGIRRAKRGGFCGGGAGEEEAAAGWDPYAAGLMMRAANACGTKAQGKVRPEDVAEAARLASAGQAFEVAYYPRASTPEFCVRAAAVRAAVRVQWAPGMRFKMAFETEDSSRISWFMGTVAGVQVADPVRWPHSPWRLLQVTWDEPDLLQNVKRVSPWLVELVSSVPAIHLASSFPSPPPRKKPRIPELPFEGHPAFPPNLSHHHYFLHAHPPYPSFPFLQPYREPGMSNSFHSYIDLHLTNLQSSGLYPGLRRPDDHVVATAATRPPTTARVNTDLTIGGGGGTPPRDDVSVKKPDAVKPAAGLMLFGQTILTQQQMDLSNSSGGTTSSLNWNAEKGANNVSSEGSGSGVIQNSPTNKASSERQQQWFRDLSEPGQCKVFMESDTVGRDIDLTSLSSFDELYHCLAEMFCVDSAELRSRVLYRCATGEVKHAGDEAFSDFVRSARRVTILTDAGSDNLGSS